MAIFDDHKFGKLNDANEIEYFAPKNGGLVVTITRKGKATTAVVMQPTEAQMNAAGWYRVVDVEQEGTDHMVDNIIYHYIGVPDAPEPEAPADGE